MQSFAQDFVGVVRVPAENLVFLPTHAGPAGTSNRLERAQDILKLVRVYQDTGLDPSHPTHQIFGIVTPGDLHKLSRAACTSPENLLQTAIMGRIPLVTGGFQVLCVEGRRRIEAAKLIRGGDTWWTIRLHCIPDGQHSHTILAGIVINATLHSGCIRKDIISGHSNGVVKEWL